MRAALKEIAEARTEWQEFLRADQAPSAWPYSLLDRFFGQDDVVLPQYSPKVRIEPAYLINKDDRPLTVPTHYVSRTELNDQRLARANSLRTTEAVFAGSEFIAISFVIWRSQVSKTCHGDWDCSQSLPSAAPKPKRAMRRVIAR